MSMISAVRSLLGDLLRRDRYLVEILGSLAALFCGFLAAFSQEALETRAAMRGITHIPLIEVWLVLAIIPGTFQCAKYALDPRHIARLVPIVLMGAFWTLAGASLFFSLDNWEFWTAVALLLGLVQGYAVLSELRELRWACALLGFFFWFTLAASVTMNVEWPLPLGVGNYWIVVLGNFLSISRLAAVRGA